MKNQSSRLAFAIAAALITCTPAFAGNVVDYPDFVNSKYYPADVKAIHFQNCTIDVQHSCVWGAWSVAFGGEVTPTAEFDAVHGGGGDNAGVRVSLWCTNSIAGSKDCGALYNRDTCVQAIPGGPPLIIDCPESIEFTDR